MGVGIHVGVGGGMGVVPDNPSHESFTVCFTLNIFHCYRYTYHVPD